MLGTMKRSSRKVRAFTLIELLVAITIIVILMGLLFPAFRGVQDQAKKIQVKNDLTQIVTAVNAYYTEYGKYPLITSDTTYGASGSSSAALFNELRGTSAATDNPRRIVFISPPDIKDTINPRAGIGSDGQYYDPWGPTSGKADSGIYHIRIDGDYDNQVDNPYTANTGAGFDKIRQGVVAWSLGKDGGQGTDFKASDDVISWQ